MTYTEWYTRSRSNEFRAKLKILVSRFIISPSFLFSFSSYLSPLLSLSLFELRANIITKIEIEVKRLKKSQEWFRVEIPLASSAMVDRHRFFASGLTRFSSPRQRRGSTVVPTDFFFFFYHSYTTALPTCYSYTNAFGFELFINFILIFTLYYLLKRQAHMNTRWSVLPGRDRSVSSPGLKLKLGEFDSLYDR